MGREVCRRLMEEDGVFGLLTVAVCGCRDRISPVYYCIIYRIVTLCSELDIKNNDDAIIQAINSVQRTAN